MKKIKKSYRLGMSTGILAGMFIGILFYYLNLFFPTGTQMIPMSLLMTELVAIISSIAFGFLFVAQINLFPIRSIYAKVFVLNLLLTILFFPLL